MTSTIIKSLILAKNLHFGINLYDNEKLVLIIYSLVQHMQTFQLKVK
jgi:hypothetical protein